MPENERPRERALRYGLSALSNRELLAIVIRHGNKQGSALVIADRILKESKGLVNLARMTLEQLTRIKGLKQAKGLELLACLELGRRMSCEACFQKDVIADFDTLVQWLKLEIGLKQQELFLAVYLDVRNQILHHEILFKGTLDHSLVHPREIFQRALQVSGARLIVVHNHPSGNPEPSPQDILITERLVEIGQLMNIELLDHVIVAPDRAFSFRQAGLLD